jgi:hypothetical protein
MLEAPRGVAHLSIAPFFVSSSCRTNADWRKQGGAARVVRVLTLDS